MQVIKYIQNTMQDIATLTPILDLEIHNQHRTCWQIDAAKSPAFLVDLINEVLELKKDTICSYYDVTEI